MVPKIALFLAVCATTAVAIPTRGRQIGPVTGGSSQVDPNSQEIRDIALFAVNAISNSSNSGPLSLVRIVSATSAIVAGTNYQLTMEVSTSGGLQTCNVSVFDQPWTETRTLTSFICSKPTATTSGPAQTTTKITTTTKAPTTTKKAATTTLKPTQSLLTTPKLANSTESTTPKATASTSLNSTATAPNETVTTIKPADTTSTTNISKETTTPKATASTLLNSTTTAPIKTVKDLNETVTTIKPVATTSTANISTNGTTIQPTTVSKVATTTKSTPKPIQNQRPNSGGFSPIDSNDPIVAEVANFAVNVLSSSSNSGPLNLIRIVSAEQQVVAGSNYRIVVQLKSFDRVQTCTLVVFDQPWTSTRQLISSQCQPKATRLFKH